MLDELRIRGLGVIDEAALPLGPGLTVVTGETGAGKTMVVTALLLLFGGRADAARVRTGSDQASVDGRVLVAALPHVAQRAHEAGAELDDNELVLRRVVSASGRSRAYVGGAGAPVSVVAELAEQLIAVHGQSDQLRLVRPAAQRAALDRYAGIDPTRLAAAYDAWQAADAALTERTGRAAELRREADLLAHGIAEIEAAAPQPDEADVLARLAARLGHADALTLAARTAHDALLGDPDDPGADAADVSQLFGQAARVLGQQAGADSTLDELAGRLAELGTLTVELGTELGGYAASLDADPARLEQIEARRAVLAALVRKYCGEPEPNLAAVLHWADTARARLADLDVSDEAIAALRSQREARARELADLAVDVATRRRSAAVRLAAAVTVELGGLAMPDASLTISLRPRPADPGGVTAVIAGMPAGVGRDGADEVELLLRPHPGAPSLPISRGASGGELSRVMLALEVCLAATDPVPTLVFDEVDAGVGGRAALEVGRRLARLAHGRQVLVVTHLAQVAVFADRHVRVDKPRSGKSAGVTASDVQIVSGDARLGELARMLAGSDTPTARDHAAELLRDAAASIKGVAAPPRAKRPRGPKQRAG